MSNLYKLKIKEAEYTIPKENICLLAMSKAMDTGIQGSSAILTPTGAIEYLESLGIQVLEAEE